jgi:heme/copper-type cytochrome/quinol oxidase subunit 4
MEHKEYIEENVEITDPEHDYHGHPNYRKVFVSLLELFAVSLVAGYIFPLHIAVILIFLTAAWKTALVVRNFMHLKFEPIMIWIAMAAVIFCLFAFYFGVYPDITAVHREVVPR